MGYTTSSRRANFGNWFSLAFAGTVGRIFGGVSPMEFAVCPAPGARDWRPLRGAVRYPLHLRVTLLCDGRQCEAVTEDVSASGLLLRLEEPLQAGQTIDFLLEVPAGALGFSATAAVHGTGRIVRSYWKHEQPFAAAVIDEYRFQ